MSGIGNILQAAWEIIKISSALTSELLCHLMLVFNLLGSLGNFYSYLVISVDRLIFVEWPLRYVSIVTEKKAIMAVVTVWVVNVGQTCATIKWELHSVPRELCTVTSPDVLHRIVLYIVLFSVYVVTFFILTPIYGKIAHTTHMSIKNDPSIVHFAPENRDTQRKKIREQKMTQTLAIIFFTYLCCILPVTLYYGIVLQFYAVPFPFAILVGHKFLILVYKLQGLINPFIFATKNALLRKKIWKIFGKQAVIPNNFQMY